VSDTRRVSIYAFVLGIAVWILLLSGSAPLSSNLALIGGAATLGIVASQIDRPTGVDARVLAALAITGAAIALLGAWIR
jgi:hypothetical protein